MIRCSCCEFDARYAKPTGPLPSPVMMIGEKPGQEEAYKGVVFVGDAGKEVDRTYLPLAGIDRGDCYVTNCVKCRLGGNNNKPKPWQVESCAREHIPGEIEQCNPTVIVLMGATACSLVPGIEVEKDHGLPVWFDDPDNPILGGYKGWLVPMFHPAAGLHNTSLMIPLLEDWTNFGRWWTHDEIFWSPRSYEPDIPYSMVDTIDQFEEAWTTVVDYWLGVDTENDGPLPWSLQFSGRPGTGFVIMASNQLLIDEFARRALYRECWIHNASHDIGVLDSMGVRVRHIRDTMQEAFHLGNLPKGLKALAWRLLGIKMRSWEDVVLPPSRAKFIEWLNGAWGELSELRERKVVKEYKKPRARKPGESAAGGFIFNSAGLVTGRFEMKPIKAEKDVKRILSHSHKPDYDIWGKAREEGVEIITGPIYQNLSRELGPYPIKSLVHAPIEEAVDYAAQDADIEGRIGLKLIEMRKAFHEGLDIDPDDYDQ